MATTETLTATIDRLIALFNAKSMDLPDGFFDRRTQFVLNGAPCETLLGQRPTDPLVLMLARGPAGYRFTAKALQHALPAARVERDDLDAASDPFLITTRLRLSGTLRGSGERLDASVGVTLKLSEPGRVGVAEADVAQADLDRLKAARMVA
jgi:hypothetical protein